MDMRSEKNVSALFQAITSIENEEECFNFFEDICTVKEIREIAQRFEVAQLLWLGKNYSEINQVTGASTATICRVKKCLIHGKDGYRAVLSRMYDMEDPVSE